jgi:hypothetical protein
MEDERRVTAEGSKIRMRLIEPRDQKKGSIHGSVEYGESHTPSWLSVPG